MISDFYKSTKGRIAASLATLTLAGALTVATPIRGQDIPEETAQEVFIGPVEQYEYQGPKEFKARYGEAAFQELQGIQQKYAKAMQAENAALSQAAQMQVVSYIGLENLMKAQLFAQEVMQEFNAYAAQNDSLVQGITRDVQAALEGSTEGLEENLEKYLPVVEGAINLAKENALEYYQENQEFVDKVIADAEATLNNPELKAASEEFQTNVTERATTQFMEFYQRNKPVIDKLLQDAEATVIDEAFWSDIQKYQDSMKDVLVERVMGEEFAAEVDSMEVRVERLATQQNLEIQELINKLERQRALEKGF